MGTPKALLRLEGETFLARAARLLLRPGVVAVVAVVGHEAERVLAESALPRHVVTVVNPRYREGMLGSVLAGLEAAEERGAQALLLHPVDHPLIEPDTVDRVIAALVAGARLAVPSFEGRRGHPAGFAAAAFQALRAADPRRGARQVLREHPDWIVHVAGDEGSLRGIDTRVEYARLVARA